MQPSRTRWRTLTVATVLFALAGALYAAWDQDWTYDEPFHLEWTERLLASRNAGRESPHYNAKTPVMLPNVLVVMALRRAPVTEPVLRFASRLPSVLWLAAILAATFAVGRRLFGVEAAHIATVAAALDPNLVAHGSLATVDAAYALATLLTAAAAVGFAESPSTWRSARLGLALGFALSAKFSAILLVPALLLLPVLKRPPRQEWRRWATGALAVCACAAVTVCAAYLFLDVATPLGARPWDSRPMARLASALPGLRLPVPAAFLTGYDASLAAERGDWNVVILGRWYPHGVWFYFAVLWLLKTPLLVLLAEIYGLWRAARARLDRESLGARLLLVMLLLHLGYFSLLYRTQLGYRFVLMCVPIAYLLAAAGLAPLAAKRRAPAVAALVVLAAVLENGMYFGNPLAFTNAAVWPKRQAFRLMADSNLDWGQHSETIQRWLAERPGLHTHLDPPHFLPGHNTFSVNEVAGATDFARHRFLRENADPGGHFGHTHVWFDVDQGLFGRFLDAERRLTPGPGAEAACPADQPYQRLAPGSPLGLSLPKLPRAGKTWIACVSAPLGTDFGLSILRGQLKLGLYREGSPCEGEVVGKGQEIWHRLDPGTHVLCAAETPGGERWIRSPLQASWQVGRREAWLYVREGRGADIDAPPQRQ